jgi:hypothetical protein
MNAPDSTFQLAWHHSSSHYHYTTHHDDHHYDHHGGGIDIGWGGFVLICLLLAGFWVVSKVMGFLGIGHHHHDHHC